MEYVFLIFLVLLVFAMGFLVSLGWQGFTYKDSIIVGIMFAFVPSIPILASLVNYLITGNWIL